jgi:hypothetical protein
MEDRWRTSLENIRGYVQPIVYPLHVVANSRGRKEYTRACLKIDPVALPTVPCVYVMRYAAHDILRIGTAVKGLQDRVLRGYNRPYPAGHPSMTVDQVYYEYENWAGGAHLTNALGLQALTHDVRGADFEVEVYVFIGNFLV